MTDNELLLAISNIVNANSKTLEGRMDRIEEKIDTVEDNLTKRMDVLEEILNDKIDAVEQRLDARIDLVEQRLDAVDAKLTSQIKEVDQRLGNDVHAILLNMENVVMPRLNTIESCYTSTYDKYKDGTEKIERMEQDIDVLQDVVKNHSLRLQAKMA